VLYLDALGWSGAPTVTFRRPDHNGRLWRRAWVIALDHEDRRELMDYWPDTYRLIQDEGQGMIIQGTREWTDYRVSSTLKPHMVKSFGVGARVQGLRRYYALVLDSDGTARLVKALDGNTTLAQTEFDWQLGGTYTLALQVKGNCIQGWIDDRLIFEVEDTDRPLTDGAIALLCEEGRVATDVVTVQPAQ
jgi:hypothetical protein